MKNDLVKLGIEDNYVIIADLVLGRPSRALAPSFTLLYDTLNLDVLKDYILRSHLEQIAASLVTL